MTVASQFETALIDLIQHLDNTTPALQARLNALCKTLRTKEIPTSEEGKNNVWVLLALIMALEYPRLMTEVNHQRIHRFATAMALYTELMPPPTAPRIPQPPHHKDR